MKYHLVTFGCQMNKNDSERLETIFHQMGMEATQTPKEADLVLLNSCSVRQSAEDRIFGAVRQLGRLKEHNPNLIIAVTGCMPGRDRDGKLRAKLPEVDFFFPTKDMVQLPRWLAELNPRLASSVDLEEDYLLLRPTTNSKRQAFVTIQTGCNKFCTYCVVPMARGLERNRPLRSILEEIRELSERGCFEITLLGQTVNSYQIPDPDSRSSRNPYANSFAALLWEINHLQGIRRIHFTAPYPTHMTEEVIDAMTLPAQVQYLHLPVQSGNDVILQRMNRRYTATEYLQVVEQVRKRIPDIALGTDIIVGFPGETAEQFLDTVAVYKKADFDISYTALYSARTGTLGYKLFTDDVPREEKKRRWNVLQELMEKTVLRKNQAYQGQIVSVLVDLVDERGLLAGNSREMKLVKCMGPRELVGEIIDVRIREVTEWVLYGERVWG